MFNSLMPSLNIRSLPFVVFMGGFPSRLQNFSSGAIRPGGLLFFVCWKYCTVPLHLQLLVKWEVVSPNSRYRQFYQIVDIHVGNFNMKLTGRWFPQIVDRDSGNLYPIYI